ncbi:MAG: hypothetical protein KAF64_03090 [Hydrogenophaga sp.]|uniref:hypothetical protein n=1 Tax=Hydrogenophaga sp. TaxID=1904254 RepID=UPI0025B9DEA9|nr:hypothetical protein [Hydrogenophaga sp.]MBU7572316.1 hypothetical protein [Hydrogenophaga sp.]
MLSSVPRAPHSPGRETLPAAPTRELLIERMQKRYNALSRFKQDLLAEDTPIQCINRAIELIQSGSAESKSIAHAMMGLGPADKNLANEIANLTLEQKNVFKEVLSTMRRGWQTEDARKTLIKLQALSEWMTSRLNVLTPKSNASTEASSGHWRGLDEQRRPSLQKRMPIVEALMPKVAHRQEADSLSRGGGLPSVSFMVQTESVLASEKCRESRRTLLNDLWRETGCDRCVVSENSRFLLRKMQEEFQEDARMGRAISASTYEQYPLMFAVSHLCEDEFGPPPLSGKYVDQAWRYLSQAPCSTGEARLLASALAKMAQFDLMHWFLEVDGYSLKALTPLLAQGSASWLRELTASFVGLKSTAKTRALQTAVTALGSPRVADIVRKGLGDHWVEPSMRFPQMRPRNHLAEKVAGIGTSIAVGLFKLLK